MVRTRQNADLLHVYSKQLRGTPPVQDLVAKARVSKRRSSSAPVVKRARQLRPDEVEDLIEHYRENGSVIAAAKALGITRQTAGSYLAEAGFTTKRRMSEVDIAEAASAYNEGQPAARIGRPTGFDPQTVLTALRGTGVVIRPRPGHNV